MTTKKNDHTVTKDPEKTVDVPPYGSRNPDPLTDQPGSHPIETGIGAVIGGVASGLAVGAVGGPVGAVIGGIVGGAAAGGLAGKGVGELVDPTTEDNWIREYMHSDKATAGASSARTATATSTYTEEQVRPAYRYGLESANRYEGKRFEDIESHLKTDYERNYGTSGLAWNDARGAVRDAYDRTIRLHEERLKVNKQRVSAGDVTVRKEVITENKQITVPVEREEVVIERRPATGHATGDIRAETIRVPVSEERVDVTKETVATEEVNVGKRKVQDTKTVGGTVRKEEVRVEETGNVDVKGNVKKTDKR